MNTLTERRLLREILGEQGPAVVCQSNQEQKTILTTLRSELENLKTIRLSDKNDSPYGEKDIAFHFSIKYPNDRTSRYDSSFTIGFDHQNVLCLKRGYGSDGYHLNGRVDQLESLVNRFLAEVEHQKNKKIKTQKINNLKTATILARIREIAVTDEFDFYCELKQTKVKLVIRVQKSGYMEVDIPFRQFQEKLQGIRNCVRLTREIGELKVIRNIKFKSAQRHRWRWITHESLKKP